MSTSISEVISKNFGWAEQVRQAKRLRQTVLEKGCYIYAAGGYGQQIAQLLLRDGYDVKGFVDRAAVAGQQIAGLSCFRPDEIDPELAAAAALIFGVNNFRTPIDEASTWAEDIGFAEIVYVPELPDLFGRELGNYWQAGRRDIVDNASAIDRVHSRLADARSRQLLEQLVAYRISGRPADHPMVDRDRQYFPDDLPMSKEKITVIDCGAFPGDLLDTAAKTGIRLDNWYAFEPDPSNFRQLSAFVRANAHMLGSAALFPCGVGNVTGTMRFATGNADASRALDQSEIDTSETLPLVRLDDTLQLDQLDMIKLDIEGFEADALDGCVDLLARHRPRLAMAIYHKPADLWELPLKVDAMLPGGKLAIRQHGFNGYDTVLYVDWN